ncbi:MAG: right-handed parallel beta-helix repeat-containing protein [Promethearchaeota archaeon]
MGENNKFITILVLFLISSITIIFISDEKEIVINQDNNGTYSGIEPINSDYWNNFTFIHIDNNWTEFEKYSWFKGDNCINNTIINNTISYNAIAGIYLYSTCKNNSVIMNQIYKNSEYGIRLNYVEYNNILNNTIINNNQIGIGLYSSSNLIIKNNYIKNNLLGAIYISNTNNTVYSANKLIDNGFRITFPQGDYNTYFIFDNNTINGRKIYFYYNKQGLTEINFSNAGQIILFNCSNVARNIV